MNSLGDKAVHNKKIKLGVIGLGRAFTLMLPTFLMDERIQLVAAADTLEQARVQFTDDFNAPVYDNAHDLCNDPTVNVVYIASPHQFHVEHAELAIAAGKHILMEKPLALSMEDCHKIVQLAQHAKTQLLVGHSHSFNKPILLAREMIERGEWGEIQAIHAFNFTDFMYRPRRPEELDTSQGGGVVFSQGAHQLDIVRLLGGGMLKQVHAYTREWDRARPSEGFYTALLSFESGALANVTYSGYGHFDSDALLENIGEMGHRKDPEQHGQARFFLKNELAGRTEAELKAERNYGGQYYTAPTLEAPSYHQHFGHFLVSLTHADLRILPHGIEVFTDEEKFFYAIDAPVIPRKEVIDELYDAIYNGKPVLHSAAWARATLEVCLAVLQSAEKNKAINLTYQCALSV